MGKVKRSWRLLAASVNLMRANPSLRVFPIISALGTVTFMCLFFVGGSVCFGSFAQFQGAIHHHGMIFLLSVVVLSLPFSLVTVFCNSALVGCVLMHMEGKPHGWRDGLRMAWARRRTIIGWTLFCVFGLLFLVPLGRTLPRIPILGPHLGKLFLIVMGVTWALVTFLVVPVIVFEEQPNIWACLRRSEELFRRTWGEQIVGRGSVLVFMYVIAAIIIIPLIVAKHSGLVTVSTQQVMVGVFALSIFPVLAAFSVAIQSIFGAVCYSYAVTGMLPQEFSAELLPPPRKA
jgi:hypothetical protein